MTEREFRMRRHAVVATALLLVVAAACRQQGEPTRDGHIPVAVDEPAPGFTLPSASGATVSLSDYVGKPVLLYFSMGPG